MPWPTFRLNLHRWWPMLALLLGGLFSMRASPGVRLNELMYHPPDDRDELQWIELHNASTNAMDLSGWSFDKGITFVFPASTRIAPGGFLVVARQRDDFLRHYGTSAPVVLGNFQGRLSHSGESVELVDRNGSTVDSVRYRDDAPWPSSPDGVSPSLERLSATADSQLPSNWAPSSMPARVQAAGTPGKTNSVATTWFPPVVESLEPAPWADGKPTLVSVRLSGPPVREVTLDYQVIALFQDAKRPAEPPWFHLPMSRSSGDAFTSSVPILPAHHLVRLRVKAVGSNGIERVHPHPHDTRPTLSIYLGANTNDAQIPFLSLHEFGPPERRGPNTQDFFQNQGRRNATREAPTPVARGHAVALFFPTKGAPVQVFDHVRLTPRKGGWKLRLHKDRLLEQMSTINVIFEEQPRQVLSEHLAYELFREAGVPTPLSGHWRVWHNGIPHGFHLFVEQINGSFLRRNQRNDDGDLFKILWYEDGVAAQHEKKNNADHDHSDLERLVGQLRTTHGERQWDLIQRTFNVDTMVSYYAVNMCLQNWDGFFNNHFVYQAPQPDGRWEVFPWDNDKTWGDYDGASAKYNWYSMPLTFSMEGDAPHRWSQWWRPGGWFSAPLLANPQFRSRFLNRIEELCRTTFSPEGMAVAITRLERRLEPEIALRATLPNAPSSFGPRRMRLPIALPGIAKSNPGPISEFKEHLDSFRHQTQFRREFLLKEIAAERAR